MTQTRLPPREDFYSNLTEQDVSPADYLHAQTVWNKFDMKTFEDYHDLYLMTDVISLSDVVQQFRRLPKREYDLDPLHYYSAPGLSWGRHVETGDDSWVWEQNDETFRLDHRFRSRTFSSRKVFAEAYR